MVGRDDKDEIDDDDLEGDVLILDPEKLQKRLPNLKFENYLGRPEPTKIDDEYDEQLILEPDINVIKKRAPTAPNFDKQIGREEPKNLDDEELFVRDFDDDPIPKNPMDPKVVGYNFGLGPQRFNLEEEKLANDLDFNDDHLDLDPQLPERRVKGYIDMSKGEERFREKLNQDPFYEE